MWRVESNGFDCCECFKDFLIVWDDCDDWNFGRFFYLFDCCFVGLVVEVVEK